MGTPDKARVVLDPYAAPPGWAHSRRFSSRRRARERGSWLRGLVATCAALALLASGILLERADPFGMRPFHRTDPTVAARGPITGDEAALIARFQEASPSVVYITRMEVKRHLFRRDATTIPAGTGSGIVWDGQGHIVTNYHVIRGANGAKVTLADHSTWNADLVGVSAEADLAVLRIRAPEDRLQPITIGTSSELQVGQYVLAIGNPFGLDHTLSTGVISGVDREIRSQTGSPITGMIQTDAAINPGNSGGPLLDSAGRLIGVNTAIVSPSGASAGIGFAVPVDTVRAIVPRLIQAHARDTPRG